jgi:hypothetical protein
MLPLITQDSFLQTLSFSNLRRRVWLSGLGFHLYMLSPLKVAAQLPAAVVSQSLLCRMDQCIHIM